MRILMLAESYAPVIGGEERMVDDLSHELSRRGHHVAVATLRQPTGEPPEDGAVRVHLLDSLTRRVLGPNRDQERNHAPPVPDPQVVSGLRRVIDEECPDLVHAHNWIVNSYLPLDRRYQLPLVLSMHDYGLICATKRFVNRGRCCTGPGPLKCIACAGGNYGSAKGFGIALGTKSFSPWVRRSVDVLLPVSAAVQEHCELDSGALCRIVPNFIGEVPPAPSPEQLASSGLPDEPFLLFVGDATEDKGSLILADAYARLEAPPPLVLIGRCFVDGITARPGIVALGPAQRPLVIEAMRRSLFTVVPSIVPETFGLVALEAALAGKAVVGSSVGGLPAIIVDGETGILVPPGDEPALEAALRRLLSEAGLRSRMGEAAKRRAADFSADAVLPRFEEAYGLAIEARRMRRTNPQTMDTQ